MDAHDLDVKRAPIRGFEFDYAEAGKRGNLVIFLHGFPETLAMWRKVLPRVAEAGFHAVALNQRGYSPRARPVDLESYRYVELAEDVLAFASWLGYEKFHLVGHDWGAIVGWSVLARNANRIYSWTSLSIPHYTAFAQYVRDDINPLYEKSLRLFLAADGAAERVFSANDFARLKAIWSDSDAIEMAIYVEHFRQSGALTGALNYYRACEGHARAWRDASFVFPAVEVPTLLIWGRSDPFVLHSAVERAHAWMRGPYTVLECDAGHWLVQKCPDLVIAAICEHVHNHLPHGD